MCSAKTSTSMITYFLKIGSEQLDILYKYTADFFGVVL